MPERVPFVAGNFKMNDPGIGAYAENLAAALAPTQTEVWICPPCTALSRAVADTLGTPIEIAAQNMHQAESGAFTGEVSAPMLAEIGVRGAILGHSERRELFGETDEALRAKLPAALEHGLVPILCCGETDAEREAGKTDVKLRRQVELGLADVEDRLLGDVVIAYEPIWAIGTGKNATPEQAQESVSFIRALVAARTSEASERIRILYGGSVKAANAAELLGQPDIDGALVGGASLDPHEFAQIVAAAS